jgi:hypothetical protein
MKLLRLNQTSWVNPNLISMVVVSPTEEGVGKCSVYCQGAGALLDINYADPKLLKMIQKILPKPESV